MIDGGPGAVPRGRLDAWLVTDERAELAGAIRKLASARDLQPYAGTFRHDGLRIECRRVVHTNHPTYAYRIRASGKTVIWAPEFYRFPRWAGRADVMFAEGAAWDRPIRFAGGVGGHMDVLATARQAKRFGVKRLVFAHLGRPTLRALSRRRQPPFGELAADGQSFQVARRHRRPGPARDPGDGRRSR
jgi:hypothetical protein